MVDEKHEWEEIPDDESDEARTVRSRLEGVIRDVVKKTLNQGSGARAVTEEVARALASEMKLPKEVAGYLLSNADNVKNEIMRVVAKEVRGFLESANLGDELARILTSISFEVRTEVRFIPNEDALRPSVRSRVGVKSTRSDEVLHEGESSELDQALRAGLTEFLGRVLTRGGIGGGDGGAKGRGGAPARDAAPQAREPESPQPAAPAGSSMQTSAERRQQLRKALARRRERSDS